MNEIMNKRFRHAGNVGHLHVFWRGDALCLYDTLTLETAYIPNAAGGAGGNAADALIKNALGALPATDREQIETAGLCLAGGEKRRRDALDVLRQRATADTVKTIYFIPTMECNFHCGYCTVIKTRDGQPPAYMTVDQAVGIIDQFYEKTAGVKPEERNLMFFGGEPFLAADVTIAVMKHVRETRGDGKMNISCFTNASTITEEIAQACAKYGLYALVSFDGPPEINDRVRRDAGSHPTFEKTLRGYRMLKDAGCRTGVSLVLGSHNVENLRESVTWLLDELEPAEIKITGAIHPLEDFVPNPFQADAEQLVVALVDTYTRLRDRGVYSEQFVRRIRPFVDRNPKLKDCTSCGGKVIATPFGLSGHCEHVEFRRKASVGVELIEKQDNSHEAWNRRSPIMKIECADCWGLGVCGGGCIFNALSMTGSLDGFDVENCKQTRVMLEWVLGDLFDICMSRPDAGAQNVLIPAAHEREQLLGSISAHDSGHVLKNISNFGERPQEGAKGTGA